MRIAVWHNLPSGGGKRALYQHVRGLVERGHKIESWTLSTSDSSYLPLSSLVQEHVVPFATPTANKFLSRLSGAFDNYRNSIEQIRAIDQVCAQVAGQIESGEFDILFANSSGPFYMPFIMRHIRRLPKVLYLQEPCRPFYEADPILPWVGTMPGDSNHGSLTRTRARVYDWLSLRAMKLQARHEWLNARACDEILVNSYYSRETIARVYGCDARVCYLGVDTERFRPLNRERENFVVGVGALERVKGVELALEAIALLPEPRPKLVWVANAGNDAYRETVVKLASRLGVDFSIRSRVTDDELLEILNRAAAFVYAPRLEPFGYAPLEANACGTPVVAVAEGGVRETIRDGVNGLLVDRDPQQIAAALARLLEDKELARRMGDAAIQYVRSEWSLDASVRRLEERLFQVLSSKAEGKTVS